MRNASDRPRGLFFYRTVPEDATLSVRIGALLNRKAKKLVPYGTAGKRMLESEDMALMDPQIWLLPSGILVGCLWEWMKSGMLTRVFQTTLIS